MREEKIQEHIADLEEKLACLMAKDEIRAFIGRYRGESVRGLGQELYDWILQRRK